MTAPAAPHAETSDFHSRRVAGLALAAAAALVLAGCSSAPAAAPDTTPEPTATAVSYPIPDGCPSAEDMGKAWVDDGSWYESIDAMLLTGEVATALPDGACAYAMTKVGTASDSSTSYRTINAWYFNLSEPGKQTIDGLRSWGESAGGTPSAVETLEGDPTGEYSDTSLSLPDDFSGWTGSTVGWVDGESSTWFSGNEVIPEFTQGASAKVAFSLNGDRVDAIVSAQTAGVVDVTTALAQGRAASFANTFTVSDDEGYTALVDIQGRMQPYTSDIANSPPGKFEALSTATLGGTVTNTTTGRNMTAPGLGAVALYPMDSSVCRGSMMGGISVAGASWGDSSYCSVGLGFVEGGELAVGGSATTPNKDTDAVLGPFAEGGDELAGLNSPVAVYALFGSAGALSTNVEWKADKGCLVQTKQSARWAVVMPGWPELLCI